MKRLLPALALALSACSHSADPATTAPDSGLSLLKSDTLVIAAGASATLDDGTFSLAFQRIENESRCATNVTCVWAGDAAGSFVMRVEKAQLTPVLHTNLEPRQADLGGYEVRLLDVTPYPVNGQVIAPGSYKARVVVNRGAR
ncbi:MAG: hypothetical protein JWO05_1909 [Gemmatimonadetes bacterium]|nr:hypothetical protein [Gemmatimonadota bacterium]